MNKKILLILFSILLFYASAFAETYNLSLRAGENLISLPLTPEDTNIANILLPILSQIKDVWEFNPSDPNDPWKHYQPGMAEYSDLSQMDVGKGYWINVKSNVTLPITGTPVAPNYLLNLKRGWNAIGWPYQNTQTITAGLVALNFGTDYTQVSRLNSSTKAQENFLNQSTDDNFTAFEPGKAYYIYMLQNKTILIGLSGPADITPPTGTITINAGSQYANATTVTLTLTATDAGSGMGSGAQMRFSNDNLTWSAPEDYATDKTWVLSSGEGQKTLYVKYKDVAGNWSQAYSDTIILDTTPPSISIDSVLSPTNQNVVLSYFVSDNFTPTDKILVSGDNSPYIAEGVHNVTLTARDLAGNSATTSINFTIDKTAPVVIITSPQNGSVVEDSPVHLQGRVDGVAFSESRALNPGENTLTKTASDSSGNTASASVTVYLYIGEVIGPEGGVVTSQDGKVKVVIPAGALSTPTRIRVSKINKETLQEAAPSGKSLLSVVGCKPYGLVFVKPVELIYSLEEAEVPGTAVELGFYDSIQDKIISTGQTTVVPTDGYTVSFSLVHFSTYAALKSLTPRSTPIGAGVKIPLPDLLTGAFSHAIPITLPPGRTGMQPVIHLTYRSSNANSWVGLGFSLNPGYIVRSTRLGPPTYNDTTDTFYFITDAGTTELVNLIDNLYQAKVESSFTKFFKEQDDCWRAVAKDGSVLRFGQDSNAKETSNSGTFAWYLTKAVDTNGNYIEYQYTKDQGKSYLLRIEYTGNESGLPPTNTIEFSLESRNDSFSSYISTSKIATTKRLKEIQVMVGYDLVWRYVLEYSYSPDTNRSLLHTITQKAGDDKALPTQTLSYQQAE